MEKQEKSVLVAMSGGVDSSVAVYLMQQQGYRCEGATMRLYKKEEDGESPAKVLRDIGDARAVAERLGIPYEVLDFTEAFEECVVRKFIRVYEEGGTPNPCVDCNRSIKFGRLLNAAEEKGLAFLATGHYARVEYDPSCGRYLLKRACDLSKDQSYVLYSLSQDQLAHIRFPLGEMSKAQVRELAERLGFRNAQKQESQDICFVPDGDYAAFMERHTGKRYESGAFVNPQGEVVGTHRGAVRYTIGQRKGLGLALGKPVYVLEKDMRANTVTVGEESALFARVLHAKDANWIAIPRLEAPLRVQAKTRYRQTERDATVYPEGDGRFRLEFDEPQRAFTAGQAAVLYRGDLVVGGGTICEAERE